MLLQMFVLCPPVIGVPNKSFALLLAALVAARLCETPVFGQDVQTSPGHTASAVDPPLSQANVLSRGPSRHHSKKSNSHLPIEEIVLLHDVTIQVPYGQTKIPAGTRLKGERRRASVKVDYLGGSYNVPACAILNFPKTEASIISVGPKDLETRTGEIYRNAKITQVTPASITVTHDFGVARVLLRDLPLELQKKYGYEPDKAAAFEAQDTFSRIAAERLQTNAADDARAAYMRKYNLHKVAELPDVPIKPGPLLFARDGTIYGTSALGGRYNGNKRITSTSDDAVSISDGFIYSIRPNGTAKTLFYFNRRETGEYPSGALIENIDGSIFGITTFGGEMERGTIYRLKPTGEFQTLLNLSSYSLEHPEVGLFRRSLKAWRVFRIRE